ncbi:MAG: ferric reductase-like transmembrane domain-containing protein [Solirubrobacteraceae bacterium]
MTLLFATSGPSAYWYLTRSTGAVAMVLLTLTVVLGVIDVRRFTTPRLPRFVIDSLHRNVSLLVVVFLAAHIITAVLDSFTPIPLIDAVLPFVGSYRPFWLGLGAVSFDLILALAITSLLRQRVGYRAWRAIHWLAYASWPIALLHGLGTGSDVKSGWLLALSVICLAAVLAAVCVRVVPGWPANARVRGGALAAAAIMPIGLALWLPGGPLGKNWARRSGTPTSLLASTAPSVSSSAAGTTSTQASNPSSPSSALDSPFEASLSGSITQGPGPGVGLVAVKIATTFTGSHSGQLDIEIDGQPVGEGGVTLRGSHVTLANTLSPAIYRGRIVSLNGTRLLARVARHDGHGLSLQVDLAVNSGAGTVSGTLAASPIESADSE